MTRDWAKQRLALTRRELVRVTDALYRIPLTDKNVCVFLAEDNHCLIERHEGRNAKPEECRNFPFAAVRMPDGEVAYDTSASCKNVAEKLLLAFAPIAPAEGEAPPTLESEAFPARISVTPGRRIEMDAYQQYLLDLRRTFENPDVSPERALTAAWQILRALEDASYNLQPFRFPHPFRLSRYSRAGGSQPLAIREGGSALQGSCEEAPDQRAISPVLERFFTFLFLRKPYGIYSWMTLLTGRPYADPRIFGEPVDLKGQASVEIPAECNRLMNAFLYGLLQRKVMLTRGYCLGDMLGLTLAGYWLTCWYARTLAHITGRTCVSENDLSMAIRLCERYYTGHQPRFLAMFSRLHRGWWLAKLAFK